MLPTTITNTEFVNHLHEMTPTNDNQPAPQTAESKKLREHLLRATGEKITAEHYAHHLCNLIGYPLVHYPQHLTETLITNPHNPQQLKTPLANSDFPLARYKAKKDTPDPRPCFTKVESCTQDAERDDTDPQVTVHVPEGTIISTVDPSTIHKNDTAK